jgi:Flp pilus assembly protein CpaB
VSDFEVRRAAAMKEEVARANGALSMALRVAAQTEEKCRQGDHVTRSHATGGRGGHVLTRCLCCDYTADGYD